LNVKTVAFRLLSKKDYFSEELKRKLIQKGFSVKEVEETILYLQKEGYIDDKKLLERYKELSINKGESPLKLKSKLYRKGITEVDFSYDEELEAALNLLQNKFKKEKNYQNVVKFLKNRGFSYSVIQEAVKNFL
jgi:regulatory protein